MEDQTLMILQINSIPDPQTLVQPAPNLEPSGKFTLVLDSSQVTAFLECPQLWSYSYQQRLGLPHMQEKNEAMNAGTYGHKLLEIYYSARLEGKGVNEAMAQAFAYNPDDEICECGCLKVDHRAILEASETICSKCAIKTNPCLKFSPVSFLLGQELRMAVRTRLKEYCYTYINNDFQPNNQDAIEVGFSQVLYEDDENLFVTEGRIDLIGSLQGLPCIVDHKFQNRAHQLYKKSIQFKTYALVSHIPMLIINYIRLTKGVSKDTLVRDIVTFSGQEMHAWKKELTSIFFRIKQQILANKFDQNWSACGGRYGWPCIYTTLCEEQDSELIQIKKQQLYVEKPEWRPWT